MSAQTALKIKIQLLCGSEIAMGPGKADLLDHIDREGSISGAARAMDMSYRRAWLLVDAMNRCWSEALVSTSPGRAKGGGARLTELGGRVLERYRTLQTSLAEVAGEGIMEELDAELRNAPRLKSNEEA